METIQLLNISNPKATKQTINKIITEVNTVNKHFLNEIDRVNGKSENKTITNWSERVPISKNDPFNYYTTVVLETPVSDRSVVSLANTDIIQLAMYGYVIQNVEGQTVTIYAVDKPATSVTLTLHVEG